MINPSLSPYVNEALIACEQALERPERWFSSCAILSNLLASSGLNQDAYLWQTMARQNQPSRVRYHLQAGLLYAQIKNWKEAIAQHHKALAVKGNLAIAYFNLSQIHRSIGQADTSIEYLYRFTSLRPEQPTAEECEALGQALAKRGQSERAIQCYRWAIENNPKHWTAYYRLADFLIQANQADAAIRCYQRLLTQDHNQTEALQKLGMALLEQNQPAQAIDLFRRATQLEPTFVWPYLGLVKCWMALEQWEEAIATCKATLHFVGELPWAYSQMAKAFTAIGNGAEASCCYQKVCALSQWPQAESQNYQFSRDTFTHQIELWSKLLASLMQRESTSKIPLKVLEIGCSEGMISCWLLDQVLVRSTDQLVCLDQDFSALFLDNIERSGASDKVSCHQGPPPRLLAELDQNVYDLALIQDRCKKADHLHKDVSLTWPLLKVGGIMIVKDYLWPHPEGAIHSPKAGIDRFLQTIPGEYKLLYQSHQLIIQKSNTKI